MCLVIDTCCLARVFDPKNAEHDDFIPVLEWISTGKGKMIYGGTKYKTELQSAKKYLRFLTELEKKRRLVVLKDMEIDPIAESLKLEVPDTRFDDEHIVAIVIVSKCRIVCTTDKRAIPYIKRKGFYSKHGVRPPKIYSRKRHRNLCCDANIVGLAAS